MPTRANTVQPNIIRYVAMLINNVSGWCYYLQGTLYTGLADGRIVKLEGDKVVDVVRTGKTPCGKYDFRVK